jgi:hypothetical protein
VATATKNTFGRLLKPVVELSTDPESLVNRLPMPAGAFPAALAKLSMLLRPMGCCRRAWDLVFARPTSAYGVSSGRSTRPWVTPAVR